jgi:serine/threonine protein phosphatase PrpC
VTIAVCRDAMSAMPVEVFSVTDTGRSRSNNEDSVTIDAAVGLLVLADGMGGYLAGEVASSMATSLIGDGLGRWLREAPGDASGDEVRRAMESCVDQANRAIFDASRANPRYAGMGTTLVVAVLRAGRLWLGHVGDSRAYRLRDGRLTQVTRDHSLLQEQIDAGLITPQQATFSANRNLVTRALGVEPDVPLETSEHDVLSGDMLLLCSDGLTDMLDDATIANVLSRHDTLAGAGQALVAEANAAGGKDNIAVALARPRAAGGTPRASWWPFGR